MAKRSLASSKIQLDLEDDDNMNVEYAPVPINKHKAGAGSRRRSSFGGGMLGGHKSPVKNSADQAKLAQMYTTIIKMSSENKITSKNSWDLNLIDHMGQLIKEDTGHRGVNFQKASCTLDASVKIYSNRVDDTWTSSYRILENLSRNGTSGGDAENGDERGPARVGSKSISSRNGLTCTIESDKEKLNQIKLESDYNADPMFHKMSLAFDEGGAKGMLMNNLRVVPGSSTLVFTSDNLSDDIKESDDSSNEKEEIIDENTEDKMDVVNEEEADDNNKNSPKDSSSDEMIDVSEILLKSGITLTGLQTLGVAQALDDYREILEVPVCSNGLFDFSNLNLSEFDSSIEAQKIKAVPITSSVDQYAADDNFGCDDYANADYDDNIEDVYLDDDHEQDQEEREAFERKKAQMKVVVPNQKLDWNTLFTGDSQGNNNGQHSNEESKGSPSNGSKAPVSEFVPAAVGDDYTFLNFASMNNSNSWAGARHWKFAPKRAAAGERVQRSSSENVDDSKSKKDDMKDGKNSSGQPSDKIKKPSNIFALNFHAEMSNIDAAALKVDPKKMSGSMLTQAAIDKANEIAKEGAYTLPHDAKLGPKDLCRLFCSPQMIVPPVNMKGIMDPSSSGVKSSKIEGMVSGQQDIMWGDMRADIRNKLQNSSSIPPNSNDDSEYDNDDNFVYNDDDYEDVDATTLVSGDNPKNQAVDTNILGGVQGGLQIRVDGMLQATRKVEKINIGYSTISKRVNVKNLKSEIWDWVDTECPNKKNDEGENIKPDNKFTLPEGPMKRKSVEEKDSTASFQDMISNIAKNNQREVGQEVSVSYYFICLLHLANEKGLKIEDQSNFADLQISKDTNTIAL